MSNKYTEMQRSYYNNEISVVEKVGNYDYHENFPYETFLLHENGDLRKPLFEDFSDKNALDFGCGEGRMVRRLSKIFKRVDGCDISKKMLEAAQPRDGTSNWYLTSGEDCGEAPNNSYDFVYSTISMQHICVFDIRDKIIQDIKIKLKEGGKFTLQLLYNSKNETRHHSSWYDNNYEAKTTNSGCDVLITPNDLPNCKRYFEKNFKNVKMWFCDISRHELKNNIHPNAHMGPGYHGTHFIFISGEK